MSNFTPFPAPLTMARSSRYESSQAQTALKVGDLCVTYGDNPALENINLEVYSGERVAIIGPNGAGKSTLMQAIMGLLQPQSGGILIGEGSNQRLGYVPQHEAVDWDFPVTVRDVVMMGQVREIGWFRFPGRKHWQAVDSALERVGMLELGERQISELSGGQRRRAFIARALVTQADILLLDEPFSGVDASAQADLMDVLRSLNQDGITILLSTHDLNLAFQHFDKVMALRRQVIAYGTPQEVYRPEVLSQLYGGRLATWDNGRQVMVFVDEHGCADC